MKTSLILQILMFLRIQTHDFLLAIELGVSKNKKALLTIAFMFLLAPASVVFGANGLDQVEQMIKGFYTDFRGVLNAIFGLILLYYFIVGFRKVLAGDNQGWIGVGSTVLGALLWYKAVPAFMDNVKNS